MVTEILLMECLIKLKKKKHYLLHKYIHRKNNHNHHKYKRIY